MALTLVVTFAGAAGIYALEPHSANVETGFASYTDALWWTAMVVTTMGVTYWPRTPEARVLTVLISLYAIGVFGYITATLATFLIGREAASRESDVHNTAELRALRRQVAALRRELRDPPT